MFANIACSFMKGVIYMIDRKNLEKLITSTQIVLLERVRKLGEAAKLLDDIKLAAIDELNGDDSFYSHTDSLQNYSCSIR